MPVVAIGGAVMTFFGATVVAGTASAVIAGAIGGAIVGAVVGGVTAGLSGGNVGKGMLKGAITGAVTGAFAGYMQGPTAGQQTAASYEASAAAGPPVPGDAQPGLWGEAGGAGGAPQEGVVPVDATAKLSEAERIAQIEAASRVQAAEVTAEATAKSVAEQAKITAWTEGGKGIFGAIASGEEAKEKLEASKELLAAGQAAEEAGKIGAGGIDAQRQLKPTPTGFQTRQPSSGVLGTPVVQAPMAVAPTASAQVEAPTAQVGVLAQGVR